MFSPAVNDRKTLNSVNQDRMLYFHPSLILVGETMTSFKRWQVNKGNVPEIIPLGMLAFYPSLILVGEAFAIEDKCIKVM